MLRVKINRQVVNSTSQAGRQVTGSSITQVVSTASWGASTGPWASSAASQAGSAVFWQSSAGPQGASTTPQTSRQETRARANNPWGSFRVHSQNRGNTLEEPNLKWVINLSSKPLTQAQRSVLA